MPKVVNLRSPARLAALKAAGEKSAARRRQRCAETWAAGDDTALKRRLGAPDSQRKDGPTRICRSCGRELSIDEFYVDRSTKSGRKSSCRDCVTHGVLLRAQLRRQGIEKVACEVCGRGEGLVYDHDHATGRRRGILCRTCNLTLGHVEDDVDLLAALAAYVARYRDLEEGVKA